MDGRSEQCRKCKPSYKRTAAQKKRMSEMLRGKPKPWLLGRKRPDHAETMRAWWTAARREKMRERQLKPSARYHGLSSRQAVALVRLVGECERCNHDGSRSRLGVHHRNRDKKDHMKEHRMEIGWAVMHQKRRTRWH